METIKDFELTERLNAAGFTTETFTNEDGFTEEADRHTHIDITKPSQPTLKAHVELDTEGVLIEAFIEILDEDGKSYINRDMAMFIEDADCESLDALVKRLKHVFS